METKKYSSYAEINHDLEILKLKKEIHYKKMLLSIDKTKESFLPSKNKIDSTKEKMIIISFTRKFNSVDEANAELAAPSDTMFSGLVAFHSHQFLNRIKRALNHVFIFF